MSSSQAVNCAVLPRLCWCLVSLPRRALQNFFVQWSPTCAACTWVGSRLRCPWGADVKTGPPTTVPVPAVFASHEQRGAINCQPHLGAVTAT